MTQIEALPAARLGFRKGGEAEKAENTAALQEALNSANEVIIPDVDAVIGDITLTRANTIRFGAGVLKRGADVNKAMFKATGLVRPRFIGANLDANPAGNPGSGSHDAIRLVNCTDAIVEDGRIVGARGLYNGAPVGAGVSVDGGSGLSVRRMRVDDSYDGLSVNAHLNGRSEDNKWTANKRTGMVVGGGSHGFYDRGDVASGNSTQYAGAGQLIIASDDCVSVGAVAENNALGHGRQHNNAKRCVTRDLKSKANGISNLDHTLGSIDCLVDGGSAFNATVRNLEADSGSHGLVVRNFKTGGAGHVDFSIYRTKAKLYDCTGNVLVWTQDPTGAASQPIWINGGHYGNTITLTQNETGAAHLFQCEGIIVDPGGHVVTASDCSGAVVPVRGASLQSGWVADTSATYLKTADGMVHLGGRIKSGTVAANTTLFTLPAGYRPAATEYFMILVCGSIGGIYILTDGRVCDMGGSLSAVWSSLNGISFRSGN